MVLDSQMESKRRLRLRAALERWLPVLVGIAIIGTVVFGWLAVSTHITPGMHTEERVTLSWSTDGNFEHEATVQNANSVFPVGTTVENRPLYYSQIMPIADGTFEHSYRAVGDGSLTIVTQISVVIRSTGEESSTEYWRVSRELISAETSNVAPGETAPVEFSVNVSRVQQRLESIRSDLGSTPGTIQTAIVADVEMNGTVSGKQIDRRESYRIPVSFQESTYSFGAVGSGNQYEQRERVMVTNEYSLLRKIGSLAGLGFSVMVLLGFVHVHRRGISSLSSIEQEQLAYLDARSEYDDWITSVELPAEATPSQEAMVGSLEGLVDLAIDTEERVLADSSSGRYLVVHDGVTYVYNPPTQVTS